MLKSLDVLIGLTVVLLALSMAVTVITQLITTLVNSRGRHLRRGLVDLLQQLDPALTPAVSKAVASAVLTHPLVSGSAAPFAAGHGQGTLAVLADRIRRLAGGARLGNVIHREEFTKLLMAAAAGEGTTQLEGPARSALIRALANNGVADPESALRAIRTVALQLEGSSPGLSNTARHNLAILRAAESDFVAKINNWFDQTMDRTSQRFTASTRAITFAGAVLVAFGLQVDTTSLVNRLAADDALRAAFVQEAQALHVAQVASGGAGPEGASAPARAPGEREIARQYQAFLAEHGIVRLPRTSGWAEGLRDVNLLGVLLTALLLSLGAPFWYNALGRLLQLRSVLAARDDAQRAERQADAAARAAAPAQARSHAERGDAAGVG